MLIDGTPMDKAIWDYVYDTLHFHPSYEYKGHSFAVPLPFQMPEPYAVYGIGDMTEEQVDLLNENMREILIRITAPGQKIYALDWQHSSFLFDPRNPAEMCDQTVPDEHAPGGSYNAYFPAFVPDGDYYFFIDEHLQFGYLGHPWREEVWVFGDALMQEIAAAYQAFGWTKLK